MTQKPEKKTTSIFVPPAAADILKAKMTNFAAAEREAGEAFLTVCASLGVDPRLYSFDPQSSIMVLKPEILEKGKPHA